MKKIIVMLWIILSSTTLWVAQASSGIGSEFYVAFGKNRAGGTSNGVFIP